MLSVPHPDFTRTLVHYLIREVTIVRGEGDGPEGAAVLRLAGGLPGDGAAAGAGVSPFTAEAQRRGGKAEWYNRRARSGVVLRQRGPAGSLP